MPIFAGRRRKTRNSDHNFTDMNATCQSCGKRVNLLTIDGKKRRYCPMCREELTDRIVEGPVRPHTESLVRSAFSPVTHEEQPRSSPTKQKVSYYAEPESVGLLRDGDLLVVNFAHHRFPEQCVITGEVIDANEMLDFTFDTNRTSGGLFARYRNKFPCRIGLKIDHRPRFQFVRKLANWMMYFGSAIMASAGVAATRANPNLVGMLAGALLLGLLLTICGIVGIVLSLVLGLQPMKVVKQKHKDNAEHFWVKGVHRDFLQGLPMWR